MQYARVRRPRKKLRHIGILSPNSAEPSRNRQDGQRSATQRLFLIARIRSTRPKGQVSKFDLKLLKVQMDSNGYRPLFIVEMIRDKKKNLKE